ncbi:MULTISPECIES: glycoside hydrolase family 31 protein [Halanaerobium]|uniref:Alpha-glucosidase, glycosyl hydrolase family GH31 n=1 Tax=Halanaerobium kushneri TaxID=56779 RepID=A0A1N6ZZE4_9FIRM|nr:MULTISPECIES: TIM-barrel domain-containing protein [Halanaerobium]RCW60371.1 alpha-glucosidase (family GH31 glycosyl hydrolase) [Halanaerobium sp. ST460_2HS_T2]SIR32217.1 Alpha-glucosidase, glycosyl hydrolase family GH31 [Halanaerobium kushneri]
MQKYNIKHIPEGFNDPYRNFDFERIPRKPVEDDFVIIKAIIEPDNLTEKDVFLNWKLNGKEQKNIKSEIVIDHVNDKKYYKFELGRFSAEDKIEYYISVKNQKSNIKSNKFEFITAKKYKLDSIEKVNYNQKNNFLEVIFSETSNMVPRIYFYFDQGNLRISLSLEEIVIEGEERVELDKRNGQYFLKDDETGIEIQVSKEPMNIIIRQKEDILLKTAENILPAFELTNYFNGKFELNINFENKAEDFFGFGERYNSLNQKGLEPDICVYNEYLYQKDKTYIPVPFFFTLSGFGLNINTPNYIKFSLNQENKILQIKTKLNNNKTNLNFDIFTGKPRSILKKYLKKVGQAKLPPKWVFGPWMSGNSWNSQDIISKQIQLMNDFEIPATVIVAEAWSDESTFYIFNEAEYDLKEGKESFTYDDFKFSKDGKWPDPKSMVENIHNNNLKFILWQIPIIRKPENNNRQHLNDEKFVIENNYCVLNEDGSPYRIPDGWFKGSLLLDFNNQEAVKWWFEKRKYLTEELNVDGFKTDGGEFVFDENIEFADGKTGMEMRNEYPISYIKAYNDFIGEERITFSRAGFSGAQKYPIYWGGDQISDFKTLKNMIVAGLSMNISGNPFWGWDIGGFSGEIPTAELFIRSTQMAVFCPVMQFHSENYLETDNWDRSPWNIAERTESEEVLNIYRDYANLRMNLIPYIYQEASNSANNYEPMMRPLVYDYPQDQNLINIEDQYLFGRSLLVAPIIEKDSRQREIYLPAGKWIDFWNGQEYQGNKYLKYLADLEKIPVFIKNNSVVPLNLNEDFELGKYIGNELDEYNKLAFWVNGNIEEYTFEDDLNNKLVLTQTANKIKVNFNDADLKEVYILTKEDSFDNNLVSAMKNDSDFFVYQITNE